MMVVVVKIHCDCANIFCLVEFLSISCDVLCHIFLLLTPGCSRRLKLLRTFPVCTMKLLYKMNENVFKFKLCHSINRYRSYFPCIEFINLLLINAISCSTSNLLSWSNSINHRCGFMCEIS